MASQVEHIKWVPGTPFMVDGFRFQTGRCKHYFLTHAHGDHTTGLNKSFCAGIIYCTPVTARLLVEETRISPNYVTAVNLDSPFEVEGIRITAICANHCPGACMFLFQPSQAQRSGSGLQRTILHTGDFRCVLTTTLTATQKSGFLARAIGFSYFLLEEFLARWFSYACSRGAIIIFHPGFMMECLHVCL